MLIDTNIFIEFALRQENHKDCGDLLDAIKKGVVTDAYITNFTLNAVQAMARKKQQEFIRELLLLIIQEKIKVAPIKAEDQLMINSIREEINLDFDDATQWVATNILSTYIVTYDKDFENTGIEVKTPSQVLAEYLE